MRISSVRLGHANNSSSTHSILLNCRLPERSSNAGPFEYGWDWFHLKNRDDKARYMAALLYSQLQMEMADEHAGIVAKELTGFNPAERDYAYVDHQSVPAFPYRLGRGSKKLHHGFLKDFVAFVRDNPRVSIRGGNDNDSDPERLDIGDSVKDWAPKENSRVKRHAVNQMERDCGQINLYARKDKAWWTLYNRDSGAKLRLSFQDDAPEYFCASTPELVDVKITDYCPFGCEFCYMSSTPKGRHADRNALGELMYEFSKAEVFEVALGGGETTMHPEFPQILEDFAYRGVTPNFTTFSLRAWKRKKKTVDAVLEHAGSFAVSNLDELDEVKKWNEAHQKVRATLQIPLGCHPREKVLAALREASEEGYKLPVTLLGYKHHGRGKAFTPEDYTWVIDQITHPEEGLDDFGADTLFVEQFGDEFKKRGVSPKLMVGREGAFSCYIDAVTGQMGASSYTEKLHPLDRRNPFASFPYANVS